MKIGMPFFLLSILTISNAFGAKSQALYLSGRVPASITLVEPELKKNSNGEFSIKSNVHPSKYEVKKNTTNQVGYIEIISR